MSKGLANLENICASVCKSEGQQNGTLQVKKKEQKSEAVGQWSTA